MTNNKTNPNLNNPFVRVLKALDEPTMKSLRIKTMEDALTSAKMNFSVFSAAEPRANLLLISQMLGLTVAITALVYMATKESGALLKKDGASPETMKEFDKFAKGELHHLIISYLKGVQGNDN